MFSENFTVPPGVSASLSIIDTTGRVAGCAVDSLLQPPMDGFKILPAFPSWAFLVESQHGRNILFDLGIPQDWPELPPSVSDDLKSSGWAITVPKTTAEILEENKVAVNSIDTIVWSHWHWDHIGDLPEFPHTTQLVVGPGFKDAFLPGYPANPNASHPGSYFESVSTDSQVLLRLFFALVLTRFRGRQLREIDFEGDGVSGIGELQAFDFFGDGSFYLLNTPGHAIGHMSGLVRTTVNPDTFVVLGGDLCHHPGEMRPSPHRSLPRTNGTHHHPEPKTDSFWSELQRARERSPVQPFFDPKSPFDFEQNILSIQDIQKADAMEDIFLIAAHDRTVEGIIETFPAKANEWKTKGWKQRTFWSFFNDFQEADPGANSA